MELVKNFGKVGLPLKAIKYNLIFRVHFSFLFLWPFDTPSFQISLLIIRLLLLIYGKADFTEKSLEKGKPAPCLPIFSPFSYHIEHSTDS